MLNKLFILVLSIFLLSGCGTTGSKFLQALAGGAQGAQQSLNQQQDIYDQSLQRQQETWKQYQEQQYRNQQLEYQRRQAEALEKMNEQNKYDYLKY